MDSHSTPRRVNVFFGNGLTREVPGSVEINPNSKGPSTIEVRDIVADSLSLPQDALCSENYPYDGQPRTIRVRARKSCKDLVRERLLGNLSSELGSRTARQPEVDLRQEIADLRSEIRRKDSALMALHRRLLLDITRRDVAHRLGYKNWNGLVIKGQLGIKGQSEGESINTFIIQQLRSSLRLRHLLPNVLIWAIYRSPSNIREDGNTAAHSAV
ncbi:hypothetical protein HD554DRAFT_2329808 [Boletus coccyginus]|nr:hypothetical protein HD554DRAFT_2329808 [Boletus coccyginus]